MRAAIDRIDGGPIKSRSQAQTVTTTGNCSATAQLYVRPGGRTTIFASPTCAGRASGRLVVPSLEPY